MASADDRKVRPPQSEVDLHVRVLARKQLRHCFGFLAAIQDQLCFEAVGRGLGFCSTVECHASQDVQRWACGTER